MKNIIMLVLAAVVFSACSTGSKDEALTPKVFQEKLADTPDAVVLDVRTPEEVAEGVIPGAMNIDFNGADFKTSIAALDKSKTYFVYCAAGGRSAKATDLMKDQGFQHVYGLAGGMKAWKAEGLETSAH